MMEASQKAPHDPLSGEGWTNPVKVELAQIMLFAPCSAWLRSGLLSLQCCMLLAVQPAQL
eukprot:scaffold252761_cov22-Tisochrysis_lutea.AAC.1